MEEPLETATRSGEGQAMLLDVRQSSEEALEGAEGLERRDETAVGSGGCKGRAGGGRTVNARGGPGKLAGVLAKLVGRSGATTELLSGRTTPTKLRGLVGEDDPTAATKFYSRPLKPKLTT